MHATVFSDHEPTRYVAARWVAGEHETPDWADEKVRAVAPSSVAYHRGAEPQQPDPEVEQPKAAKKAAATSS
ncbi:MAG TPA: hypothetical protein VFE14_20890 [Micromonosporaceae bacterium]|nr:hypothetical protein [Micromonosporaceae bacterium]